MHVFDVLENDFKRNNEVPYLRWEEKMSNFLTTAQFPDICIILRAAIFIERARNGHSFMEECGRLSGK